MIVGGMEEEQSSKSPSLTTSLPKDIIIDILARIPRCDYPTLSLVSKHFRSLVRTPDVYARRSLLGCSEHCLYVFLYNCSHETCEERWYILRRKPNGNRCLVIIPSLPAMPSGRFVAVGSKVYVFGGIYNNYNTQGVLSIDFRFHTVQTLPSMPIFILNTVAGVIDGKIYVIGYPCVYNKKVMGVFNTETLLWEPEMTNPDIKLGYTQPSYVVVMGDKIYTRDYENSFVYDPVESTWERDKILNLKKWEHACVVDDVLYYYDRYGNCLQTYDPKQRCWGVVNGLEELWAKTKWSGRRSETVSYGGKLALFFTEL